MGVVAVHAVVPLARPPTQVPVPRHPPVRALAVVAVLRTVTLGAELQGVRELQFPTVREPQSVVVPRVMATQAGQLAVGIGQPLVKLVQLDGRMGSGTWA